ncbi:MAG: AzlD family protein [Bosea sp. (in: a-proteobacteria)]
MSGVTYSALTAIGMMAIVTYLCRIAGYMAMRHVPRTRAIQKGLDVLPGCIIIAAIAPIAWRGGPVAMLALLASIGVMMALRSELAALVTGLGLVAALRAFGF